MDLDVKTFSGRLEEMRANAEAIGHPVATVIIESVAAFKHILQQPYIQRWAAEHNIILMPHQTSLNKNDPKLGVTSLADYFRQGKVRLPDNGARARIAVRDLTAELLNWPDGRTSDLVMAVWFALRTATLHYVPAHRRPPTREMPPWLRSSTIGPRQRGLSYAGSR